MKSKYVSHAPFLAGFLSLVFLTHFAFPGVYWGESSLIVARSWQLGGLHPPGYSSFLQLVHSAQKCLPLGDIAYRSNLLGILALSLFSALFCRLLIKWSVPAYIALPESLAFVLSAPVLSASLAIEVYSTHLCLLIILFSIVSQEKQSIKTVCLAVFLSVLTITHHLTFVLFIPALLYYFVIKIKGMRNKRQIITSSFILMITAFSQYLFFPIRESVKPQIVWGSSVTLPGLINLVTAREEATASFLSGIASWNPIIRHFDEIGSVLISTLTIPGLILAFIGIIRLFKESRTISYFLIVSFSLLFLAVTLYESNELSSFFLPGILIAWIWSVLGLVELIQYLKNISTRFSMSLARVLSLVPAIMLLFIVSEIINSRKTDVHVPGTLVKASIDSLAGPSLIITKYSDWAFLHWYHSEIEKRSEYDAVFQHLLSFSWYYEDLVRKGIMTDFLNKADFEDSQSWNTAITASLVAQNIQKKHIRITDPESISELKTAGLLLETFQCTKFGIETGFGGDYRIGKPEIFLNFPGNFDTISAMVTGTMYYRFSRCLYMNGKEIQARSALEQAISYRHWTLIDK